jgi:hypothetical protein
MKFTKKLFGTTAIIAVIVFMAMPLTGCSDAGKLTDNDKINDTPNGGTTPSGSEKTLVGIEVTTTKDHYNLGEDLTGMVVTATYSDGSTAEVTDYSVDGYDNTKTGHQTVTVTYQGETAEFSVNVIDPTLPTVETPTATPGAGEVEDNTEITLATDTNGAAIYYTQDGTEPNKDSALLYSEENKPVITADKLTLKAFAVKDGMNDSDTLTAEYILSFTAAPELTLTAGSGSLTYTWTASDPAADSYDVYWKEGSGLSAVEVKTGTPITGAASGGTIDGLTDGTEYSVLVTANKQGYTAIDSEVQTEKPGPYIVTGSGTAFTATKGGATIGTADQPIQTVIDAIKNHAYGEACTIQFGDGTTALDIGTASASFNTTSGTWGAVTLTGKITSAVSSTTSATIVTGDTVSVTSVADIANTAASGYAVYHNSTGTFTVTEGTVSATTGRAIHNNSTGAVTIFGGEVKAITGVAVYNASTGKITVSGATTKVTSANETAAQGTILIATSGTGGDRLEITGGTVENTAANTNARVVYNASTGAVTISGGTVQATGAGGYTIYNASTGALTVSGGTVSAETGRTIHNQTTGTVTISGGEVKATTLNAVYNNAAGKITVSGTALVTSATTTIVGGTITNYSTGSVAIEGGTVENTNNSYAGSRAVYNNSTGTITVSGGTVSAVAGAAVYNASTGKITVSGTARVTSATATQGTIVITDNGTATAVRLEISGGAIENTADDGNAVYNASATGVTLDGSPTVTGKISVRMTGTVSVASGFNPGAKMYTLSFTGITTNIAVAGGAGCLTNFTLATAVFNGVTVSLVVSGADLVFATANGYGVAQSGTTYTITKETGIMPAVQVAIDSIKTQSGGGACTVQFGNGTDALDIGGGSVTPITFDGTGWAGLITLTGKLTSTGTGNIIQLTNGASIDSKADITYSTEGGNLICNNGTGTATVSGGTVSVTKTGGTETIYAMYNMSNGTVAVTGGTVSVTRTTGTGYIYAVYNGPGTVNISGGTVSSADYTVYNYSMNGAVNISGGTVSSPSGIAVYNYNSGKITVSGTARVTSGSTNTTYSPIHLANNGTATAVRLEITGGTVESTSTGANGYAVNNNSPGAIIISGGTVTASATNGRAIHNQGGALTVSGGTVSVTGEGASAYTIYHATSTGAVTISGGTVQAAAGVAVYNALAGKITVSQSTATATLITSANTNAAQGTIFLASSGTTTTARLEIIGGTIENTSTGANGNAVYNASIGAVTMSGGTVSTTATSGRAILNNSTGAVTINAGSTVSAPVNATAYSIYNVSTGTVQVDAAATIVGARYP